MKSWISDSRAWRRDSGDREALASSWWAQAVAISSRLIAVSASARVQPGLLSDPSKVVVSYTVSTSAVNLSCWTRGYSFPDNQVPRFVDVPLSQFVATKLP
ncbi:hypothetical protein SAMN05421833_12352 [Microbispora rosea]|uniref:Uncharacterized protein n=1 Tax=Microbispora rosea TaxID=58117 RepID=A0A1N7FP70_9ACTN|nr:hypothetical protein SAMN05421833_12352 [Microbispora rosea]